MSDSPSPQLNWWSRQQIEGAAVYQARLWIVNEFIKYNQTPIQQNTDSAQQPNESLSDYTIRLNRAARQRDLLSAYDSMTSCYKSALLPIAATGIIGTTAGRLASRRAPSVVLRIVTPLITSISFMFGVGQYLAHQCDLQFLRSNQPIAIEARKIALTHAPHMKFDA